MNEMHNLSTDLGREFVSQAKTVQSLIEELIRCCEERRIYENQKFGVPFAELRCLLLFGENEEYLTVKAIAHKLDVAKSRVTKLINGLLSKGLVRRFEAPHDTRVKLICLTARGRRKIEEVNAFHQRIFQELLGHIPVDEREQTLDELSKVRACMEKVKKTLV